MTIDVVGKKYFPELVGYTTRYRDSPHPAVIVSPQLELWELDDEQWRKVLERAARRQRTKPTRTSSVEQWVFHIAGLILLLLVAYGKDAR
jgi:hypothetical protein